MTARSRNIRGWMSALVLAAAMAGGSLAWGQAGDDQGDGNRRARAQQAQSLDQLLQQVRQGWTAENAEAEKRLAEFEADKGQQAALLAKAKAELEQARQRSASLEGRFNQSEQKITELEETLRLRLGTMGELFGVIRQVAGSVRGTVDTSLVSAQFPGRGETLDGLATSKALPSVEQLQHLWWVMQHEMVESGKVVTFPATVVDSDGNQEEDQVTRVGVFNVVADGKYLSWLPEVGKLVELKRQPAERLLEQVAELENAETGYTRFGIDPSRGTILSLLVETPSFQERLKFGGVIGYLTLSLGAIAFAFGLLRLLFLFWVRFKVRKQENSATVNKNNPLGRILSVYQDHPEADTETVEHRLDEAVTRESSRLERYLWAIKIVSVVAPLLGLLGTVTGMIRTFQSITLFGTGDPKLMAGGISEALVTTMIGLIVAIPLVLLHSWLKSVATRIMDIIDERSAGLVARRISERNVNEERSVAPVTA